MAWRMRSPFLLVWILIVTALSLAPLEVKELIGTTGKLHNFGHFAVFLITAMTMCWGVAGIKGKSRRAMWALYFAVTLELLETVFYTSYLEWRDIALDASGILTGLAITIVTAAIVSAFGARNEALHGRRI